MVRIVRALFLSFPRPSGPACKCGKREPANTTDPGRISNDLIDCDQVQLFCLHKLMPESVGGASDACTTMSLAVSNHVTQTKRSII